MATFNSTLPFPPRADLEAVLASYRQGVRILESCASRCSVTSPEYPHWVLLLARFRVVIDDVLRLLDLA